MTSSHTELLARFDRIAGSAPAPGAAFETLGRSREGRPIGAVRFGRGPRRVSLIAGCHADEPVGPRLLRHLAGYLAELSERSTDDPLLARYSWWIVPHANPDGAARNASWQAGEPDAYDLAAYLAGVERENPPEDVEFGFPAGEEGPLGARDPGRRKAPAVTGASATARRPRSENRAIYDWWRRAEGPFALHASLHGMALAEGPWYLVEPAWRDRCGTLMERCAGATRRLGYRLHDVDRGGEKGFVRVAPGFSTRPDSRALRRHFLARGDEETATAFRPSSMEAVRGLGGDPLTLVSEMPLFLAPWTEGNAGGEGVPAGEGVPGGAEPSAGEGATGAAEEGNAQGDVPEACASPSDRIRLRWRRRLGRWAAELRSGAATEEEIRARAADAGVRPMPVADQMRLQWSFLAAGLEATTPGE